MLRVDWKRHFAFFLMIALNLQPCRGTTLSTSQFKTEKPYETSLKQFSFKDEVDTSSAKIRQLFKTRLIDQGIERIGNVDLVPFLEKTRSMKIVYLNKETGIGSCGRRVGIVNLPNSNRIVISSEEAFPNLLDQISTTAFDIWITHERLEAAGYFDENYGLSLLIFFLSELEGTEQNELLKSDVPELATDPNQDVSGCNQELLNLAGSSGVGGGGDPFSIEIKWQLIRKMHLEYKKTHQSDSDKVVFLTALSKILLLQLETDFTGLANALAAGPTFSRDDIVQKVEQFLKAGPTLSYSDKGSLFVRYPYGFANHVLGQKRIVDAIYSRIQRDLRSNLPQQEKKQ
jgi:hypothetical protein